MVEVFKTNVTDASCASVLVAAIHSTFLDYTANFDLDDCDKILRVKCGSNGTVDATAMIDLLRHFGFEAEILTDDHDPWFGSKIKTTHSSASPF